jgi:membrane dipeptidase
MISLLFVLSLTAPDQAPDRAKALHFASIVIDTHDDTTQRLLDGKFDLGTRDARGSIDLPRMREGGLDAVKRALVQIDAVREQLRRHPDELALATTAADIRAAHGQGKVAALIGMEGGHMIANDLSVLRSYAALGVRYLTLTHSKNVEWADSSTDDPRCGGLSPFGKEVVRELNRLGVMVDVSHVSDKTFFDVLEVSSAPVIASHSSCRAICDAKRNLTDEMLRALAAKGGVVQVNYHVGYLSQRYVDWFKVDPKRAAEMDALTEKLCGKDEACESIEGGRIIRELMAQNKAPRVEWTEIVDHLDHAVKVAGIDHVGLGSDFDGAYMPIGMEDASKLPQLTGALLERGYRDADVRKILGENTLRVMAEVEKAARR